MRLIIFPRKGSGVKTRTFTGGTGSKGGYSLPNGTGGEYWEPKIRDASEAYRWLRDEQITIRPDYPYADVFWQVPVGRWTTGEVSGKLKWTWDAEH
eukprot:tig00021014_g17103.t1